MAKIFKWLAIGAVIMMVCMIAALTGMTYGIVRLLKDTRVTENNFIVVKSSGGGSGGQDSAALVGSAALNISSATVNLADEGGPRPRLSACMPGRMLGRSRRIHQLRPSALAARAGIISQALTGRRRRLLDSGMAGPNATVNPDLTYFVTLPKAMLAQICTFHAYGLPGFSGHSVDPDTGGIRVSDIKIVKVEGCDMLDTALDLVHMVIVKDGLRVEVHCSRSTCAAYYDQASFRSQGQVQESQADVISDFASEYNIDVDYGDDDPMGAAGNSTNSTRALLLFSTSGCKRDRYANCDQCNAVGTMVLQKAGQVAASYIPGVWGVAGKLTVRAFNWWFPNCCWTCKRGYTVDFGCGCQRVWW
jgi:hypothetical protein